VDHSPQSGGGGRRAQRQDRNGGGPAPLPTIGGGIPLLATCVRDARSRRFAYNACSAIPRVEASAPPQIARLNSIGRNGPATSLRNSKPPAAGRDFPFRHRYRSLEMLHAFGRLANTVLSAGNVVSKTLSPLIIYLIELEISRKFFRKTGVSQLEQTVHRAQSLCCRAVK
jgi:hypothetical protein